MTAIGALRSVPLFSQLRDGDLALLGRYVHARDYRKNAVILLAHDPSDAFFVLASGQVKVTLSAEDGREVILSLLRPGDFFGEMSLLQGEPQSASAIATEDSRLLVLSGPDFRRCLMELPGAAFGLLRGLLYRLREADDKVGGLILLDVTGRVAHLLLQLADQEDGRHISQVPTHQVMAQMVGSSRETVSRTVRSFVVANVIEATRRGVTIQDRAALEKAAGRPVRATAGAEYDGQERRRATSAS